MKNVPRKLNIEQVLKISAAVIAAAAVFLFTQGLTYSTATGTCYTEVKTCRGLPFNGGCIGLTDTDKVYC
ncbi:hypothetical protein GKQ38_03555 [Candidatus Nanohaloarchaea archaeon]|nr:hypothetical protein GKQ38_03555 [Candidatus Nanohaloarchaea archaeon]